MEQEEHSGIFLAMGGGGATLQVEHARWWWEDDEVSSNALISLKPLRSDKNLPSAPQKA